MKVVGFLSGDFF